jgi:hypothetical protein
MHSRYDFRRIAATTVVALAMGMGLNAAQAQSTQPAAPAQGPGMHAMHGGGEDMIGHLIAKAKAQLNLNTMQQGMFDAAVAASKSARQAARTAHQSVHATLQAELAKPVPDLAAVAQAADAARQTAQTQQQAVRNQWLALYATFTPDQIAVVKTILQNHMAQADSFRQKMIQRWQQMHGSTSATGS